MQFRPRSDFQLSVRSAQFVESQHLACPTFPTPEQTNHLAKVKAKVEIVGDYADMEKVWDLLKNLSKK